MKVAKTLVPIFCDYASKPFKFIANTKAMKTLCDKFEMTPEKAIAGTAIASIASKDALGCGLYVWQSMHNEKIPEEKRSFVAALDATNGILMIASQLLMFFTISNKKFQEKLFGKMFKHIFSNENKIAYVSHMRARPDYKALSKETIGKEFDKIKERTQETFKFLSALIASTTLAKRVIVPFIATPMAGWAKDKFFDKNVKKEGNNTESTGAENIATKVDADNATSTPKEEYKGNLLKKFTTN